MSTTTSRIPLNQAIKEAHDFRSFFNGCFLRWEFAGSIRRKKDTIGDIEHVAVARFGDHPTGDLYGTLERCNLLRARAEELLSSQRLTLHNYSMVDNAERNRFGEKYFGVDFAGRLHEVYMCEPDNWGLILAIRTGSADFSKLLMARLKSRGYRSMSGRLFEQIGPPVDLKLRTAFDEDTVLIAAGLRPRDWPPEKREVQP